MAGISALKLRVIYILPSPAPSGFIWVPVRRIAEWIILFLPSDTVWIKRDFNLQIVLSITVLGANYTKTRK
jgi:hypothetical protein